jgi:hypothetical protein
MSNQDLGFVPSGDANIGRPPQSQRERESFALDVTDDQKLTATADRERLARELAAIERAAAALRRAEPELESWSALPAPAMHNPRPIWQLVGLLWLSTALATVGAVFAISALLG